MKIDIVQLGAHIGPSPSDMIWWLFQDDPDLCALFVEPHPLSFKKLKENYAPYPNCSFEELAVDPYYAYYTKGFKTTWPKQPEAEHFNTVFERKEIPPYA